MLTVFDIDGVEMQRYIEKNVGNENHFDISDSIEIREVNIAGVACIMWIFVCSLKTLGNLGHPKLLMYMCKILKYEEHGFCNLQLCPKTAGRMGNSVDPYQTALAV